MKTILITGVGGDVAQGVLRVLRERFPEIRLVGTDIDPRHGASSLIHEYFTAPKASDPNYLEWLRSLLKASNASCCIPMTEPELSTLVTSNCIDQLGDVPIVSAGKAAIEVGLDKFLTAKFLTNNALPAPWVELTPDALKGECLPCIYKPRGGSGSRAVFECSTMNEARFLTEKYPGGVFQELLLPADQEVTCAVYRSRFAKTVVCQLQRRLAGGVTSWARVIDDPEILIQCVTLAELLDLSGPMNVQLRRTSDGPRIFEINPRFSSTALMRHRLGFCDVVWAIEEALGGKPALSTPVPGREVARTHDATVLGPLTISE